MENILAICERYSFFSFSVVGVVAIFYFISILLETDRKYYNIDNHWVDCIGTMTDIGNDRSGATKFLYSYNGNLYEEGSFVQIHSQIMNDKYYLKVNPQKPDRFIPLEWKPTFTADETTHFTHGTIKKVSSNIFRKLMIGISTDSLSKDEIVFVYDVSEIFKVSGRKLEKYQYLPPNYKSLFPNLKIGRSYLVEYWDKNPERAIIYLNKPAENCAE